jgi:DNA (cytosine-5)-methyltransferase 1
LLGHHPVVAVERDAHCQQVLSARQKDGYLPWFPIYGDVRDFDGRPWRGLVDVVAGGFPCTDISAAGKGAGIDGKDSGLWREMARIVDEVRPSYVFVENSPMLVTRGLALVLGDLAEMGYDATWCVLGARHIGAPHDRDRIWILGQAMVHADRAQREGRSVPSRVPAQNSDLGSPSWWATEPGLDRVATRVADRLERLRTVGNGQVPPVAAVAWMLLKEGVLPQELPHV